MQNATTSTTVTTAIRVSKPLYTKIVKHRDRMRAASPGVKVTLSDAIRSLLETAIASGSGK